MIMDKTRDKKTLEGFESNKEYIVQRLNWNEADFSIALEKYPSIVKRSASMVSFNWQKFRNKC